MSTKAVMGTVKTVTSLTNPLVKSLRALHLKKHRDETGLFLAEGLQLVRYAIEAGWKIETLVCAVGRRRPGWPAWLSSSSNPVLSS